MKAKCTKCDAGWEGTPQIDEPMKKLHDDIYDAAIKMPAQHQPNIMGVRTGRYLVCPSCGCQYCERRNGKWLAHTLLITDE